MARGSNKQPAAVDVQHRAGDEAVTHEEHRTVGDVEYGRAARSSAKSQRQAYWYGTITMGSSPTMPRSPLWPFSSYPYSPTSGKGIPGTSPWWALGGYRTLGASSEKPTGTEGLMMREHSVREVSEDLPVDGAR